MPPADGGREAVVVRVVCPTHETWEPSVTECPDCLQPTAGPPGTITAPLADPVDAAALEVGRLVSRRQEHLATVLHTDDDNCWTCDDIITVLHAYRAAVRAAREGGGKDGE